MKMTEKAAQTTNTGKRARIQVAFLTLSATISAQR